jgi:hypothetical protein
MKRPRLVIPPPPPLLVVGLFAVLGWYAVAHLAEKVFFLLAR